MTATTRMQSTLTWWALAVVICALVPSRAVAGDVGQIFWTVNEPPNMIDQKIYGATVHGFITTPNGTPTADWSGPNILTGTLTGKRGGSLTFTGTRDQFRPFVEQHADQIIQILFPSDPESSIQGTPGGPAAALLTFDTLVTTAVSPTPSEFAALKGERIRRFVPLDGPPTSQVLALLEGESFNIDGTSGANYKLTPGFGFNIGRLQLGLLAPLRFTDLDDAVHTNAYTLGLNLSAKYDIDLIPQEWVLSPLAGAFANAFLFTSDNIDVSGYLRYGGFVGLATRAVAGPLFLTGGLLYTVSAISIPSGLVPSEVAPLAGALTDRPIDQQLTLGAKIGVLLGRLGLPYLDDFVANLGATYVQTIGSTAIEPGMRSFTEFQASVMYTRGALGAEVGYKHIFGAEGLQSNAGFLNVMYQF